MLHSGDPTSLILLCAKASLGDTAAGLEGLATRRTGVLTVGAGEALRDLPDAAGSSFVLLTGVCALLVAAAAGETLRALPSRPMPCPCPPIRRPPAGEAACARSVLVLRRADCGPPVVFASESAPAAFAAVEGIERGTAAATNALACRKLRADANVVDPCISW